MRARLVFGLTRASRELRLLCLTDVNAHHGPPCAKPARIIASFAAPAVAAYLVSLTALLPRITVTSTSTFTFTFTVAAHPAARSFPVLCDSLARRCTNSRLPPGRLPFTHHLRSPQPCPSSKQIRPRASTLPRRRPPTHLQMAPSASALLRVPPPSSTRSP